jgi:hypothetical protein
MKKIELAYIAGVLDSDGCFTIRVDTWRTRVHGHSPSSQEVISIVQCEREAVDLARKLFGGTITIQKQKNEKHRPMFRWRCSTKQAEKACKVLLPYLRIKKRQAEIILESRRIKQRGHYANTEHTGEMIRTLKPNVVDEMISCAKKIRQLNSSKNPL